MPASKSDIFKNKKISLREKRQLGKFLSIVTGELTGDDQAALNDAQGRPFIEFLKTRDLTPNLQAYILYAIAFINVDQFEGPKETIISIEEGMERLRLFVNSLTRFGMSPFISPNYGTGDIIQAFARYKLVFKLTFQSICCLWGDLHLKLFTSLSSH